MGVRTRMNSGIILARIGRRWERVSAPERLSSGASDYLGSHQEFGLRGLLSQHGQKRLGMIRLKRQAIATFAADDKHHSVPWLSVPTVRQHFCDFIYGNRFPREEEYALFKHPTAQCGVRARPTEKKKAVEPQRERHHELVSFPQIQN